MTFQYTITSQLASISNEVAQNWNSIKFFSDSEPTDLTEPDPPNLLAGGNGIALVWDGESKLILNQPANILVTTAGTVASFRTYDPYMNLTAQGTVTLPGDGGDMTMNELSVTEGQSIIVNSFSITVSVE